MQNSTLLFFDPSNDQFAEVFGNLDTASNVAVVVPGAGQSLSNYFGMSGFRSKVMNLNAAASKLPGGGTATIAWEGYPTPNLKIWPPDVSATDYGRSVTAGRALAGLVGTIQAGHNFRTTLIGHSYGSLVTAHAITAGLSVDNFVAIGSPGLALGGQREVDAFYACGVQLQDLGRDQP